MTTEFNMLATRNVVDLMRVGAIVIVDTIKNIGHVVLKRKTVGQISLPDIHEEFLREKGAGDFSIACRVTKFGKHNPHRTYFAEANEKIFEHALPEGSKSAVVVNTAADNALVALRVQAHVPDVDTAVDANVATPSDDTADGQQ